MSLSVSAKPGRGRTVSDLVKSYGNQVERNTDEYMFVLITKWHRYTVIGWPVAEVDGGYSRASIEAPSQVGAGVWQFRITANYAWVIEYGGYRGVGPKTTQVGSTMLSGGIDINAGIYVKQRPAAPMRQGLSRIRLEMAQAAAPMLLKQSGFGGLGGRGTSTAFRGRA